LNVVCPICSKFRRIPVPQDIFEIDEGYLLKLPIHKGQVCDHFFIVVLDYHFSVRDYEISNESDFAQNYQQKKVIPSLNDFSFF
jgi:hypothetical protein